MKSILIVEDDITYGIMLKTWLTKKGFQIYSASSVARAQKVIDAETIDLILSDLRLPDHDGIDILRWLIKRERMIPLIIMTGYADIQSAVQAMKLGACDYVPKPINPDELLKKIEDALKKSESGDAPLASRQKASSDGMASASPSDFLEGESDSAKQLYNYVRLVAPTTMSVLINGASGTGKEYVAHRIHQLSKRADKPFVAIDCGAIPKELAASEFFGHVKGAFTGALTDKTGAFVEANGGTIFLDEIGNLSYEIQIQFKGTFREDLYHRINEFTLYMPLLKERKEDILLFANFFLDKANQEMGKHLIGFDEQACKTMEAYHWPGNLRQMKNTIRRATLLATGNFITINELADLQQSPTLPVAGMPLRDEEAEKRHIIEALRQTGNNKSRAAQLLGIDRKTLYNKLKLYGISDTL